MLCGIWFIGEPLTDAVGLIRPPDGNNLGLILCARSAGFLDIGTAFSGNGPNSLGATSSGTP